MATFLDGVLVDPVSHLNSVTLALWIPSGSRDELCTARGSAHMLEHVVASTVPYGNHGFSRLAGDVGGMAKCVTTPEFTVYAATVPSEYFPVTWRLMKDQFSEPDFSDELIERQRGVVIDEIRAIDYDNRRLIHERVLQELLGENSLGYPPRGKHRDASLITSFDLRSLHRRQLEDGCIPIISGGVDGEFALDLLSGVFASPLLPRTDRISVSGLPNNVRGEVYVDVAGDRCYVAATWLLLERTSSDDLALAVVNRLFGGRGSGTLQRAFAGREGEYTCHSYRTVFSDCATLTAYVECSGAALSDSLERIGRSLEQCWSTLLTDQDYIDKAVRALNGSLAIGMESTRMRVDWYGRMLMHRVPLEDEGMTFAVRLGPMPSVDIIADMKNRFLGPYYMILKGCDAA